MIETPLNSNQNPKDVAMGCLFIIAAIFVIWIVVKGCDGNESEREQFYKERAAKNPSPNSGQQSQSSVEDESPINHKTKDGYIAAISEEYLDEAMRYIADRDNKALATLIELKVVFFLKGDLEIHIVSAHLNGTVEFRLRGDRNVFWTVTEAID